MCSALPGSRGSARVAPEELEGKISQLSLRAHLPGSGPTARVQYVPHGEQIVCTQPRLAGSGCLDLSWTLHHKQGAECENRQAERAGAKDGSPQGQDTSICWGPGSRQHARKARPSKVERNLKPKSTQIMQSPSAVLVELNMPQSLRPKVSAFSLLNFCISMDCQCGLFLTRAISSVVAPLLRSLLLCVKCLSCSHNAGRLTA